MDRIDVTCDCKVCKGRTATVRANLNMSIATTPKAQRILRHNIVANAYGPMGRVLDYLPKS